MSAGSSTIETLLEARAAGRSVELAVDRALRKHGISFARYSVLRVLRSVGCGRETVGTIAVRLSLHRTSVAQLVRMLEGQGLVMRSADPRDRRQILIRMTDRGIARTDESERTLAGLVGTGSLPPNWCEAPE